MHTKRFFGIIFLAVLIAACGGGGGTTTEPDGDGDGGGGDGATAPTVVAQGIELTGAQQAAEAAAAAQAAADAVVEAGADGDVLSLLDGAVSTGPIGMIASPACVVRTAGTITGPPPRPWIELDYTACSPIRVGLVRIEVQQYVPFQVNINFDAAYRRGSRNVTGDVLLTRSGAAGDGTWTLQTSNLVVTRPTPGADQVTVSFTGVSLALVATGPTLSVDGTGQLASTGLGTVDFDWDMLTYLLGNNCPCPVSGELTVDVDIDLSGVQLLVEDAAVTVPTCTRSGIMGTLTYTFASPCPLVTFDSTLDLTECIACTIPGETICAAMCALPAGTVPDILLNALCGDGCDGTGSLSGETYPLDPICLADIKAKFAELVGFRLPNGPCSAQ